MLVQGIEIEAVVGERLERKRIFHEDSEECAPEMWAGALRKDPEVIDHSKKYREVPPDDEEAAMPDTVVQGQEAWKDPIEVGRGLKQLLGKRTLPLQVLIAIDEPHLEIRRQRAGHRKQAKRRHVRTIMSKAVQRARVVPECLGGELRVDHEYVHI